MRKLLLPVTLIVLVVVISTWADSYIYDKPYGG
jgi:hypothetical protein